MTTTIDKAGRVVIPKAVRDAMGLTPETPIDIIYQDGRIVIEFELAQWRVERSDGLPVLRRDGGPIAALTDEVIRDTVEAVRDERLAEYL